MFKFNDRILLSLESLKLERPGIGRLRVKHTNHSGKFDRSFMITIFVSLLYVFWLGMMGSAHPFFHQWPFFVYVLILLASLVYIWWPGYVEFDNVKQRIIVKRYQYKVRPAKVIPYADIKGIQLQLTQIPNESGGRYVKYFFKLKLRKGGIQPMFSLSDKRKAKKIKIWIDDHVNFDFEMKRKRIKRRKPIFHSGTKNG